MPIIDISNFPVVSAFPDQPVMDAVVLMRDEKVGSVVVVEHQRPIGILTDRDILMRITAEGKDASVTQIRDIMTPNPVVISEEKGVGEVIQVMKVHGKRRFPVVSKEGNLLGIITLDDLLVLLGAEMNGIGQSVSSKLGFTTLL